MPRATKSLCPAGRGLNWPAGFVYSGGMDRAERRDNPAGLRQLILLVLLIGGAQLWAYPGRAQSGSTLQCLLLVAALLMAWIPPSTRWLDSLFSHMRGLSGHRRRAVAMVIWIAATAYLLLTAYRQHREFIPIYVDEHSYAIGAQMAARFHLWYPKHPAGDFFEALELLVDPVYASIYFPGTAIFFAPTVWLHIPYWLFCAVTAGACAMLLFRITSEWFDPLAGLLAALLLIASTSFRLVSIMFLSQIPLILLLLLAIVCFQKWSTLRQLRWIAAIGVCAGWAAITRPIDALALFAPILLVIGIDLARRKTAGLLLLVGCAVPFIAIQIVFNLGVTHSLAQTPFQLSQKRDYPQTEYGFHAYDPAIRPVTSLPEKLEHYETFTRRNLGQNTLLLASKKMWSGSLPNIAAGVLPHAWLFMLIPAGALACYRRSWILMAGVGFWIILYIPYVFQLPHYSAVLVPGIVIAIIAGIDALARGWPKYAAQIRVFLIVAVAAVCITRLPETDRQVRDQWFAASELVAIDQSLRANVASPAVVLFRFSAGSGEFDPVYNSDVAWPDDAPIVRARDLGSNRNKELFGYYAEHQPARIFYLYDRNDASLLRLGSAAELAKQ